MTDAFAALPPYAAWRHKDSREGFEVVYFATDGAGHRIEGHTAAVEDGAAFAVRSVVRVDSGWRTRSARVAVRSSAGARETVLEADAAGHWRVDGAPAPHLDGCLDVDLESSSCTNAFPVHRLGLGVAERADAPAAYVRALDARVERLEQEYRRLEDDGPHRRFDYRSPAFGFRCTLVYDPSGLVLDYPGIALRAR
jgi:uncharacterized protein